MAALSTKGKLSVPALQFFLVTASEDEEDSDQEEVTQPARRPAGKPRRAWRRLSMRAANLGGGDVRKAEGDPRARARAGPPCAARNFPCV